MDQRLFIGTTHGFLGLSGAAVIDTASDPGLFFLRSTGTGPISYGDQVTLHIGQRRVEVDASTSRLKAVPDLQHLPQLQPARAKSTSRFVLKPLPGNVATAFADGSEFALLSDYGCLRCRNGFVQAGGAVDGDAPARLGAKFQP
jgi:hypothetical protein